MPLGAWLKFRRPTIEPVIFLYAYGLFMHLPVIQQYIYKRVSDDKGFPYSASSKGSCSNQTLNVTLKELEKEVNFFIIAVLVCIMHQSFDPSSPTQIWGYPGHSRLLSVKCSESPVLQGKNS